MPRPLPLTCPPPPPPGVLLPTMVHLSHVWQLTYSTRHLSDFCWAPLTQDTGSCWIHPFIGDGKTAQPEQVVKTAMTVALPWVCVLMAGLSWVPWLLSTTGVQPHPDPESNQSDSGQVRLLKPAINHTHCTAWLSLWFILGATAWERSLYTVRRWRCDVFLDVNISVC